MIIKSWYNSTPKAYKNKYEERDLLGLRCVGVLLAALITWFYKRLKTKLLQLSA